MANLLPAAFASRDEVASVFLPPWMHNAEARDINFITPEEWKLQKIATQLAWLDYVSLRTRVKFNARTLWTEMLLPRRTYAFLTVWRGAITRKRWNLLRKQATDVAKTDRQYKCDFRRWCAVRVAQLCNEVSTMKFNNLFNWSRAFQSIGSRKIDRLMKTKKKKWQLNMLSFLVFSYDGSYKIKVKVSCKLIIIFFNI